MRKRCMMCIAAVILSMTIAGCRTDELSHNKVDGKEDDRTVVVFKTWNPTDLGPDSPIHGIITDFEALYPHIDVQYEYIDSRTYTNQIKVELMAGEGADVYGMQTGMNYEAFRDYEEELTKYCEQAWGDDWESHFVEIAMKRLKSNSGIYGIPLGITYAGSAWADVTMLSEYGIGIPDSYTKLIETAEVLRKKDNYPLAIGGADAWTHIDAWMSIAADIDSEKLYAALNGEGSFCEAELLDSFQIWQSCFEKGIFQDNALEMTLYNDVNDMFQKEGRIPLLLNGSWALNMFTLSDAQTREVFDKEGARHQVFAIDWNDDGEFNSITASTDVILCLNKDSKVKEEAFLFMQYLVDEGQKILVNQYMEYMPSVADMELKVEGISNNGQECLATVLGFANMTSGIRGIEDVRLEEVITQALERLARLEITPYEAAVYIDENR